MTNKLVVIINSLKVPEIRKILLYEMKFLVPNYSCLQNPWLGGNHPQIPVLSVLCPQLNLLNPPKQNSWVHHWPVLFVHAHWQTGAFSAQQTACNSMLCNNSEHQCCHQVPQPLHSMVFWKLKQKYYILQLSSTAQEQNFRFFFCCFRVFRTFYCVTYHGCYAEYHIIRVASKINIHLTFLSDFI
jgi:hypothetical protein